MKTNDMRMNGARHAARGISTTAFGWCAVLLMAVVLVVFPVDSRAAGNGSGDPTSDAGKQLFEKRCAGCHSLDQDKEGPRLRGVYGSKAGSVASFKYSSAVKSSGVVWDDATLEKWLTDPDSLIPDSDMAFHVPKAEERADIIRYLRVISGK